MPEQENAALARRWFDDLWNKRLDATVHELLDPGAVGHLEGLVVRGVDEFLAARAFILNAFPEFHMTVEDTVAQGDNVAIRWSGTGVHGGELMGIQPTNRTVSVRGLTWLRFSNGRIVEGWDAWNQGRLISELQAASLV
jgi:predicted ester cyclase